VAESRTVSPRINQRAETAGVIAQMERRLDRFCTDLFRCLFAAELEPKPTRAKRIRLLTWPKTPPDQHG
jgi:hypothetical protein